jgi:dephospho-CoA kinase
MIAPMDESEGTGQGRPVLIGLTGPIGCGKSTVAGFLAEIGGEVVDADKLARQVTEPGSAALTEIRERFGAAVFDADGALNRAALAKIVFSDPAALGDLERITHPRVRALVDESLAKAAKELVPFVVVEAIKLVEGGLAEKCDEVWIVDCNPQTQRARLAGRGAAADDIERRLATQGEGLAQRLASQLDGRVTARVLATEDSLDDVRERVEDYLAELLDRPAAS